MRKWFPSAYDAADGQFARHRLPREAQAWLANRIQRSGLAGYVANGAFVRKRWCPEHPGAGLERCWAISAARKR